VETVLSQHLNLPQQVSAACQKPVHVSC